MKLRGMIFDFNGVLYWDSALHEKAWQRTAYALRGKEFSCDELLTEVHGRPNRSILSYLLQRELSLEESQRLSAQKEETYRGLCCDSGHPQLSPGSEDLLDRLKSAQVPTTIATSSPLENLEFYWQTLQLERWFERNRIVYDDGTLRGKPAPDFYSEAAKRLSLDPRECVVVEDSSSGIASARAANIGRVFGLAPTAQRGAISTVVGAPNCVADLRSFPFDEVFGP